jgi:NAD(P)-dependent dehydrogenase (short-subunit alcohol dehydrogenase family)
MWTHLAWPATGLPRLCPFGTDKDLRTIYFIYGTVTRALVDDSGRGAADWPGTEASFAARAMMGRIGEPEDVANAVVFLASPESGWIAAQVLTVDGGRMDYIGHG